MKKALSLTNGFSQMSDSKLLTRSYQIIDAMTDNANFPAPVPSLEVVSHTIDEFFKAVNLSKDGDRLQIALKNQKREAVIFSLHQWSDYVLFTSNGDNAIAMSSGFSIGKSPSPAPPITRPENLRIVSGDNSGELFSKVNRVINGLIYLHQYATDEMVQQQNWQSVPSSKTSCIIANLQPGTKYNCRVAVLGAKGQMLYSDEISRIVA